MTPFGVQRIVVLGGVSARLRSHGYGAHISGFWLVSGVMVAWFHGDTTT
jgi:hypothetical protein